MTIKAKRVKNGKTTEYRVTTGVTSEEWRLWKSGGRWFAVSPYWPGRMVDANSYSGAKYDIEKRYFVDCAGCEAAFSA